MACSPVIQPKAGAVKAPELSLYYSAIYISWSLNACSLGFALYTLSPHYIYIYTLEAQRSFGLSSGAFTAPAFGCMTGVPATFWAHLS